MIHFIWRKIFKNKWLTLGLLIGYVMATAIVSSMPIYSQAIRNRLLQKDLEKVQIEDEIYPGQLYITLMMNNGTSQNEILERYEKRDKLVEEMAENLGIPVLQTAEYLRISRVKITRVQSEQKIVGGDACFSALSNMEDHVKLVAGKLPSAEVGEDGVYEAIITEQAAKMLKLGLDSTYQLWEGSTELAVIRIVGIYEKDDNTDAYWMLPEGQLEDGIYINYDLYVRDFLYTEEETRVSKGEWYIAFDYTQINSKNHIQIRENVEYYKGVIGSYSCTSAFHETLKQYEVRGQQLTAIMWIIEIPILLLLLFYIFMVTGLILKHEKNEIAVLYSRGISKKQILQLYLMQSTILAGVALLVGPILGMGFCRIVGASEGFMTFVNRTGIKVQLTVEGWIYAAATALILILTMFFSVATNKDISIVSLKRKKVRSNKPLWQKLYLDVIALAVAFYGYYSYSNRMKMLEMSAIETTDAPVDFLLYGASAMFILGSSLVFLRIFPLLIRIVYRIGEKKWKPVSYLTLSQIFRGGASNLIISLFLIFTLSMGVLNSVMVRTLNTNQEDLIQYNVGADIVMQEYWEKETIISDLGDTEEEEVLYEEPQFSRYESLETIEAAARVLKLEDIRVEVGDISQRGVTVMGIVPDEFGKCYWYRNDLADYHLNSYLNLLAAEPRAVLMSSNLMEELGLKSGDVAYLNISWREVVEVVVYATIDYFPSYDPNEKIYGNDTSLVVANLLYLQQEIQLPPYEVWMRKAEDVTSAEVYAELEEKGIRVKTLSDATLQLVEMKNDAVMQGVNGYFTLSFLISMIVTFIGFFLYWILVIRSRKLQFAVLRSMGMGKGSVMMVLLLEQLLVSVTSVLAGLGLGTLAAALFAPFLECNVSADQKILPYIVVSEPQDYLRIIVIVIVMLIAATIVLAREVRQLRVGEALKLGED